MVWDLMQKIYKQENIGPTNDTIEWRDSVITCICERKGDIHDCVNYIGMKLMSHTITI